MNNFHRDRSVETRSERSDGFGTLDPSCIHGSDVRRNVYSGRHSIYFVPRVSPYVRPPFIPPLRLFLFPSLYLRYMRVYTFAKKTIISQAGFACGGALCVARPRSLAAFLKSSKPFRRYGAHYWLMGLTQTVCMIGWNRARARLSRRAFRVGNHKPQCRDHARVNRLGHLTSKNEDYDKYFIINF